MNQHMNTMNQVQTQIANLVREIEQAHNTPQEIQDRLCANLHHLSVDSGLPIFWTEEIPPIYRTWCINNGMTETPQSEKLAPGVDQIPFEGIEAIGAIFAEGEKKYGINNWKKQPDNDDYNRERTRHAIRHLMLWANGDRSEPHLAKVAWFCVTTIWREKHGTN